MTDKRYFWMAVLALSVVTTGVPTAAAASTGQASRKVAQVSKRRGRPDRLHTFRQPEAQASVIGGRSAEPSTFPWMAFVHDSRGEVAGSCSGTVVSPNLVVTAGHCAEDPETGVVNAASGYTVATGNVDRASPERQVSDVSQVLVYPGYETSGNLKRWGDAALLELSTPTQAPPIKLAISEIWKPGTEAVIAGWGDTYYGEEAATEQLQWATTVVQGKEWCSANAPEFHPLGQLCAIDAPTYESGTCNGDSGGPMLAEAPGTRELEEIGITSYGFGECSTTRPEVDTRSDLISSWVSARIKELAPPPAPVKSPIQPAAPLKPQAQPQLPAMTASEARSYARQALILAFDPRFGHRRNYRATCRMVSPTEQRCGVSWQDAPTNYFGSVAVYYSFEAGRVVWNDRYAIDLVSESCLARGRPSKRCPVRTRRGSVLDADG
jgi:secreted trypsin-like serine protease